MTEKVFEDIAVAAERYTGLSRRALEFGLFQKGIMDRAKGTPGYSPDEWLGLRDLVTEDFQRIGNFKEEMTLDDMTRFLAAWSPTQHWEGSFKRITEHDGVVFLELEERVGEGEGQQAVNTLSVFAFDDGGRIKHLDVYLQGAVQKIDAYDQ